MLRDVYHKYQEKRRVMKSQVDRNAYLSYSQTLTQKEKMLIVELNEWLPESIIDCHAHCNEPTHVHSITDRAFNHMLSTFPSFTLWESKEWQKLFHPGKRIRTLRFSMPFYGIDHRAANSYLLNESPIEDRIALYGLPDDPDYTIEMLKHPRVSALKMYYLYFDPPATQIYQYFPQKILTIAEERGIPIILHPPKRITVCLDQILKLIHDFPKLKVCIAHLSLCKQVVDGLEETFKALSVYPQVYFDTALVPSTGVVDMAFRIIGTERIMYGSDEPLHLIRSVPYIHPRLGERLATEYPYHWVNPIEHAEFRYLAKGTTHAHWQSLGALKTSISSLPSTHQIKIKRQIFHDNAKDFYNF